MNHASPKKREVSEASEHDRRRFWSKVERTDGCWWWRGGVAKGRGQFMLLGIPRQAHRVAYELLHGPLPPSVFLKHTCGNLLCVNPAHLTVGNTGTPTEHREQRTPPTPAVPTREVPGATPARETARPAKPLSERVVATDARDRRDRDDQRPQRVSDHKAARPVEAVTLQHPQTVARERGPNILPYAFERELSGKTVHLIVDGAALCGVAIPPIASFGHVSFVAHRDCQGCALQLHRQRLRCGGCGKPFTTMTEQGVCAGCATAKPKDVDSHV